MNEHSEASGYSGDEDTSWNAEELSSEAVTNQNYRHLAVESPQLKLPRGTSAQPGDKERKVPCTNTVPDSLACPMGLLTSSRTVKSPVPKTAVGKKSGKDSRPASRKTPAPVASRATATKNSTGTASIKAPSGPGSVKLHGAPEKPTISSTDFKISVEGNKNTTSTPLKDRLTKSTGHFVLKDTVVTVKASHASRVGKSKASFGGIFSQATDDNLTKTSKKLTVPMQKAITADLSKTAKNRDETAKKVVVTKQVKANNLKTITYGQVTQSASSTGNLARSQPMAQAAVRPPGATSEKGNKEKKTTPTIKQDLGGRPRPTASTDVEKAKSRLTPATKNNLKGVPRQAPSIVSKGAKSRFSPATKQNLRGVPRPCISTASKGFRDKLTPNTRQNTKEVTRPATSAVVKEAQDKKLLPAAKLNLAAACRVANSKKLPPATKQNLKEMPGTRPSASNNPAQVGKSIAKPIGHQNQLLSIHPVKSSSFEDGVPGTGVRLSPLSAPARRAAFDISQWLCQEEQGVVFTDVTLAGSWRYADKND